MKKLIIGILLLSLLLVGCQEERGIHKYPLGEAVGEWTECFQVEQSLFGMDYGYKNVCVSGAYVMYGEEKRKRIARPALS